MLGSITVLPFEPPADQRYAELSAALERTGTAIGPNDMLIAAHALALGCTIVTGDVDEFSRVKGLRVENWLQ
jgi:tRNA(fMet)-specific endonuclease VapC